MKLRYAMLAAAGVTLAAAGAARAADDSKMKNDPGANMDTGTGDKIDTSSSPSANPANRGDATDDSKAQKRRHAKAWKHKGTADQGTGSSSSGSTARDTMNQPSMSEDSRQQPDATPDTKTNDSSTRP